MNKPVNERSLISKYMLHQNRLLHDGKEGFGGSGWRHADAVIEFAKRLKTRELLDYGCGECTLRKELKDRKCAIQVFEYDPAVRLRSKMPTRQFDLVVCTDVLEHVEPSCVDAVIGHLHHLTRKGCYIVIATRPANKILPDGTNAHLIIENGDFWREKVLKYKWKIENEDEKVRHSLRLWMRK